MNTCASIVLIGLISLTRGQQNPQDSANPSTFNFINSIRPQPAGSSLRADGQPFRITGQNLKTIDWTKIDRRAEEAWWHLYPFGERFFDVDIANRPWLDKQIDLDFFFPYWGFRFNYTFIFPEGFIAFSYPWYIQPPYTFPNPRWPDDPDPSVIAAFMSAQQLMFVGDTGISHIWYRVISRPTNLIGQELNTWGNRRPEDQIPRAPSQLGGLGGSESRFYRTYNGQLLKTQEGRVQDPELLDRITEDIRRGIVGARGFTADYALLITWERMGYGGAPKVTELQMYEQAKKWQNTYQMLIATDEIRSYVMYNFANINWTSSTSAGALFGRGGKQSALVGFNGGNGTGWFQLPYSAEGNSYKLVQFGSTQTAGRWLARVDEVIQYGGCTNESIGVLQLSDTYGSMLGGFSLNASGPCFRPTVIIKMQIDELTLDCERIDMVIARCVIPVNSVFRTGLVDVKLSTDAGKNYPWWNKFYVLQPSRSIEGVNLINDPINLQNNWQSPWAENLTMTWSAQNISANPNAQIDITLWGYWEDVEGHNLAEVGVLAERTTNKGAYSFNPRTLVKNNKLIDAWKKYYGGVLQIRVSDNWMGDRGDGIYWSEPVGFGWYFRDVWQYEYGENWATDICIDWFEYDGRRENFIMELEPKIPCPCNLDQALNDMGRFTALRDCDMLGNHRCYYTQGAKHCVVSTVSVWTGAGQMCCYDTEGWLMFSDDYEYNSQYLRFYSAGVPYRAHPWGSFPYKRPPYVPTLSNFHNDLMPYEYCCKWAGHCEFYFWRRPTSGCQAYRPPTLGFAYGEPHFITFDGTKYTFSGKGYYILTSMKSPRHDLMVQVRMEQPPKTLWNTMVAATVITGLAAKDNSSATVQVFSRKDFRRWRYRTDVYVNGIRIFFDTVYKKLQTFQGVTIRSPPRNMNMSEIEIMFTTGVGIRVQEARGLLNVMVSLPPEYNETLAHRYDRREGEYNDEAPPAGFASGSKCSTHYRTLGLLGTYNSIKRDDLTTPDCNEININYPLNENDARDVYYNFGEKWRVDPARGHPVLFQTTRLPINDPISFANPNFIPNLDPWRRNNQSFWESLVFSRDEVRVACQGVPACEFDYILTGRREIALDTLDAEKKFEGMKAQGEDTLISCGPLSKNEGVIKHPPGNNYLDGVTVTFTCKPEYFLHGEQQRSCINGSWTPGWWVWCRSRSLEIGLKWMTGILSSVGLICIIAAVFICCYCRRIRQNKYQSRQYRTRDIRPPVSKPMHTVDTVKPNYTVPVLDTEPPKVGIHNNGPGRYSETSA